MTKQNGESTNIDTETKTSPVIEAETKAETETETETETKAETKSETGKNNKNNNSIKPKNQENQNQNNPPEAVANCVVSHRAPADVNKTKAIAVRVQGGVDCTHWRSGIQFNKQWHILWRNEIKTKQDWQRITQDSLLEIRAVEDSAGNIL